MAGMDMILCGPTDMTEVKKQLENGTFSIKRLGQICRADSESDSQEYETAGWERVYL